MEQVCRVCMSSSVTLVEIFAERQQPEEEPSLAAMLNECVDSAIKPDDPLPKQICLSCVLATQNAYKLKRTCEHSLQQFWLMFSRSEVPADARQLGTYEYIDLGCVKEEQPDSLQDNLQETYAESKQPNNRNSYASSECLPLSHAADAMHCGTEKALICGICGKAFADHMRLAKHTAIHTTKDRRFKCLHCPKAYTKHSHLQAHLHIHTGERPFKCPECPKVFMYSHHLKSHMLGHTGERSHACPHCPKTFNKTSNLQYHLSVHTGERPFVCVYCSKAFNHPSNLEKHTRTHTGKRPYKCPHCPREFTRRQHVNDHISVHTNERPFKCGECLRDFKSSPGLRMHVCHPIDNLRKSKSIESKSPFKELELKGEIT